MKVNRLSELAYEQLEEMIVECKLAPGSEVTISQLQHFLGYGRTPVLEAVKQLSINKLIIIRPRSGLFISPINIMQEKTLLPLRIEMESLVYRLATLRCTPTDRTILNKFIHDLENNIDNMTLKEFNITDRLLNKEILKASQENILENTLSPMQTLFRRSGWIYHTHVDKDKQTLKQTILTHIEFMKAILSGDSDYAEKVVRDGFKDAQEALNKIELNTPPYLLDFRLKKLEVNTGINQK